MTDTQMDQIRLAALAILEQIKEPNDQYIVNNFLAELEPYPVRFLRIIKCD